jgi:hypothetical protein
MRLARAGQEMIARDNGIEAGADAAGQPKKKTRRLFAGASLATC